jgi:uncharacterized protein YqjF (DUF2071 family)
MATIPARPAPVAGYQKWRDLLFLHWRVPAEDVQPLLPPRLTVETFDGSAWVGLVAFDMLGVRPWWCPAIPGVSAFHETNVRTYVTREGSDPGVWFFSLDAASSLAVRIARWRWHLNYYRADLRISRSGREIAYSGRRRWRDAAEAAYSIEASVSMDDVNRPAVPGTLDAFLVERYAMYVQQRSGVLLRGDVRHVPYPIRPAVVTACDETLLAAAGITVNGPPEHAVFSPGVDVHILGLQPVGNPAHPSAGGR